MKELVLILWILSLFQVSTACKCLVLDIQTQFCDGDFVIKGVPLKRKPESLETSVARKHDDGDNLREYKIKVKMIYKNPRDIKIGRKLIMKSQLESAACGVYLDVNTTYLLSGKVTEDGFMLRRCSSIAMPWKRLNSSQRKYLKKGKYKDSCDCEINICRDEDCDPKSSRLNECILGYYLPSAECYRKTAYCGRFEGMCAWITEKPFRRCIKKLPKVP